ncbi:hypothetical protein EVAR_60969_1 [Eumeta japonica]|uniref:Uncharacterized protein n=1 Tax=Eumeta variegata TaxID=151549 RepID=A0A4C1XV94_EUMVA|nr:hypothetical protein EVAR_60969_1 [Eumeta japonica]
MRRRGRGRRRGSALRGPRADPKLSGPDAARRLSELTILRAVYFRTPNFLGRPPADPSPTHRLTGPRQSPPVRAPARTRAPRRTKIQMDFRRPPYVTKIVLMGSSFPVLTRGSHTVSVTLIIMLLV